MGDGRREISPATVAGDQQSDAFAGAAQAFGYLRSGDQVIGLDANDLHA